MGFITNKLSSQGGGVFSRVATPQPKAQSTGLAGFAEGVGQGLLSSFKGLSQVGIKLGNAVLSGSLKIPDIYSEEALQQNANQGGFMGKLLAKENLTPQNTSQKIGFGAEKVAEFFIPAGKVQKTQNLLDTLITGSGFLKSSARVLSKAGVEGVSSGGVNFLQTGGDLKSSLKTGAFAGGVKGVLSGAGEVANAFRLPEKLYSTIFKNTYQDIGQELKTGALKDLQKTNPDAFKRLSDAGIVKTGVGGVVTLDETVAKQALDKGLRGNIVNMAKTTSNNLLESEYKAQQIAKNFGSTIKLKDKEKLASLFKEISEDYANVGGDFSAKASTFAQKILKGEVDAETALKLRRFLDGMRIRSSFNPVSKLSQTQENFKYFADSIRTELAKNPEFASVMKNYSFYIEAFDSLAKVAARQNNAQVLGLIDSILIGTGVASGNIGLGTGVFIGRKLLQNNATSIGQGVQNLGKSSKTGITARGALGGAMAGQ